MEPNIKINGECILEERYINSRSKIYYINLSAGIGIDKKEYQEKIHLKLPIDEKEYKELKKKLSESKAEQPVLRIKGNLELILDSICIN